MEKEYDVHRRVNKFDEFISALSSVKQPHIGLRYKQGSAQRMVCSSTMDAKHSVAIFSTDSSFPNRFSSIIGLPVVAGDGLSQYFCRPCNKVDPVVVSGVLLRRAEGHNLNDATT